MKHALIALLLCAVGGCASRPVIVASPATMTCGMSDLEPRRLPTPKVSLRTFSSLTSSASVEPPEHQRVRADMIALVRAGKLKSALELGETQLPLKEAELESGLIDPVELATLFTEVSQLRHALKRMGPAEGGYLKAIALYSQVQLEHPEMLRPTTDLAILYRSQGKPALALPLQLDAYPKLLAWLGPEHPDVIESEGELAQLHLKLKQYDEAEPLFQAGLGRAKLAVDKAAIANIRKVLAKIRRARSAKRA